MIQLRRLLHLLRVTESAATPTAASDHTSTHLSKSLVTNSSINTISVFQESPLFLATPTSTLMVQKDAQSSCSVKRRPESINSTATPHGMVVSTLQHASLEVDQEPSSSEPGLVWERWEETGKYLEHLIYSLFSLKAKAAGILEAQKQIRLGLENNPDITICSNMTSPIFSWTSSSVNPIAMGEQMLKRRQWTISAL